jgi:SAM-dependent methyltransferase
VSEALPSTPAGERNLAPLTEVLRPRLPPAGDVLEVASGTGQHVAHWARAFPDLVFQPSDAEAEARRAVEAWRRATDVANLRPPLALDVAVPGWSAAAPGPWVAIVAVNLLHIAPWAATLGLFEGAGATVVPGGRVFVYGPFAEDGLLEPESNRRFDAMLRAQDPNWGIRDLADVREVAEAHGLAFVEQVAMPANNRVLVFERGPCA